MLVIDIIGTLEGHVKHKEGGEGGVEMGVGMRLRYLLFPLQKKDGEGR